MNFAPSTSPVVGLMQEHPLMISSLISSAAKRYPNQEIITKLCPGEGNVIHRTNYFLIHERSKQLANALINELNIKPGDVVGSLAFNSYRHMELYYGVSGIGAILHTVNPRLGSDQLEYIINHGGDVIMFVDLSCLPILTQLVKSGVLKHLKKFVLMCSEQAHPPTAKVAPMNCLNYESLLSKHSTSFEWPLFDERSASSLCYTSGTTGNPKGVLYSHRSTVLHSFGSALPDALDYHSRDSILVIVPLFHANAWGVCYSGAMTGSKLVFPNVHLDGKSLAELIVNEKVTRSLAVPTVWLGLFEYLDNVPSIKFPNWKTVCIGGSACPRAMIERFATMGIRVIHAWGMTETSPMGTVCQPLPKHSELSARELIDLSASSAGRSVYGVDMCIKDDDNRILPWDGKAVGELCVRGPWITRAYYKVGERGKAVAHGKEVPNIDADGWLRTGDVCSIDPDGYIHITDRSKDVIKSGGEWISSIDLENTALGHPGVSGAAVLGIRHPKWQERPLLLIVRKKDSTVNEEEIIEFLRGKLAKWWIPDAVEFIDSIPLTATGKIYKLKLREQFKDYVFKNANTSIASKL